MLILLVPSMPLNFLYLPLNLLITGQIHRSSFSGTQLVLSRYCREGSLDLTAVDMMTSLSIGTAALLAIYGRHHLLVVELGSIPSKAGTTLTLLVNRPLL